MAKLGTLVVVVLKAKNLPNKQRIGKQDPYCAVALNTDKKRTPTVKKGGQTPEWDAELRFDVWQDMQDEMQSEVTPTGGIKPAAASEAAQQLANKPSKNSNKKVLSVSVWADDPKDPDLVGDATVDLTEPLKLGEWDEWVPLMYKGKYAGEVFLELTFYSAAPEPKRRVKGPAAGEFEPATFPSDPSPKTTPQSDRTTRVVSRPGLPEGLKPGTTSTTSPSRLSLNSAASFTDAAGLSSSLADPQGRLQHQDSRKQLRHSVSGTDLSEFGQNRVQDGSLHSGSDRPLSFFGSAPSNHLSVGSSTGRQDSFPPLRHPFDPNAYLEDPQQQPATQDQPSADPPHALPRPVSSVGLNKPLPQPGAFPQVAQPEAHLAYHQNPNGTASAPPQMSYSASFPGVHAHTQHYSPPPHMQAASSVYQPMPPQPSAHSPTPPHPTLAQQPSPLYPQPPVSTSPRPLPVPASHTAPPAQPFDIRQQMHQLTLSASQPQLQQTQSQPQPAYDQQPYYQPNQPAYDQQSYYQPNQPVQSGHMMPAPSHSPQQPVYNGHQVPPPPQQQQSYQQSPYGVSMAPSPPRHDLPTSLASRPPPLPPRPGTVAPSPPTQAAYTHWSPQTEPQAQQPYHGSHSMSPSYSQSHIPSYETAYGSAFAASSAAPAGSFQPAAPVRLAAYGQGAPEPYNGGQFITRPLPMPRPPPGWSQQQTEEYLRQNRQH